MTLIDVMFLGHWFETCSVRQASGALNELAKLTPGTAERIRGSGETEEVPATDLRRGYLILVRPAGSIPADGEVQEGESDVNEAMITGDRRYCLSECRQIDAFFGYGEWTILLVEGI